MISYTKIIWDSESKCNYVEGNCLSADTKPTDVANGSILLEMDTSKVYMYDEANSQWREW